MVTLSHVLSSFPETFLKIKFPFNEFLERHPSDRKGEMESVTRWQKSSATPFTVIRSLNFFSNLWGGFGNWGSIRSSGTSENGKSRLTPDSLSSVRPNSGETPAEVSVETHLPNTSKGIHPMKGGNEWTEQYYLHIGFCMDWEILHSWKQTTNKKREKQASDCVKHFWISHVIWTVGHDPGQIPTTFHLPCPIPSS